MIIGISCEWANPHNCSFPYSWLALPHLWSSLIVKSIMASWTDVTTIVFSFLRMFAPVSSSLQFLIMSHIPYAKNEWYLKPVIFRNFLIAVLHTVKHRDISLIKFFMNMEHGVHGISWQDLLMVKPFPILRNVLRVFITDIKYDSSGTEMYFCSTRDQVGNYIPCSNYI